MTPAAVCALARWHGASGAPPPTAFVFPGSRGEAVTPDAIGIRIRRLLRQHGLYRPGRGGHAFRRTFATRYLRRTRDLRGLQQLLRHAQMSTTALYAYPQPEDLRRHVRRLGL